MQVPTQPILICQKVVMKLVSVRSRETLDRWIRRKFFPEPVKIGRQLRWLLSEVLEWVDQRAKART